MADLTSQRQALADTRARLDSTLAELVEHVPDRQDLQASAMKIGGAIAGVVIGVGIVVVLTKSKLNNRKTRNDARMFAKTLMRGLPEVANAYVDHKINIGPQPPTKSALKAELKATVAKQALEQAHARSMNKIAGKAASAATGATTASRGGLGTAGLMAASLVGGVGIVQAMGRGNSAV